MPRTLNFAGNTPVEGALSALALEPFIDGRQPHSCTVEINDIRPDAALLPPGTAATFSHDENGERSHLVSGPGWTLFVIRRRGRAASVRVCAQTVELAREILAQATAGAGRPASDSGVTIGFWNYTQGRQIGARTPRSVDVPEWTDIRGNYPRTASTTLDRLMALSPENIGARLILLHGQAGTGKTTALRALAHSWRDWCGIDCVLDPDTLLGDSAYLSSVLLGDARPSAHRWRLLVLEDCDELVRADAKRGTGQALSRLLNLTDGLLGQGLDVLVCLTTNEDVARLHPAVVRPGRCLAEIEIGPLPPAQAREWLRDNVSDAGADASTEGRVSQIGPDGATLAELYRMRGELVKLEHAREREQVGNYL